MKIKWISSVLFIVLFLYTPYVEDQQADQACVESADIYRNKDKFRVLVWF